MLQGAAPSFNYEDDAGLLARIQEGEHAAFSMLVRKHTGRFYRVAYRFLRSRPDAEDVVQDAFIKLWERPETWDTAQNAAFTTWFHRVVVNRCLDHQKKKRPLQLIDETQVQDDRESSEAALMERQQQVEVERQIAALPDRQRAALILCFYEGLSNQEAADVMGVKLKALQSLLMRAKTALKEQLKEE